MKFSCGSLKNDVSQLTIVSIFVCFTPGGSIKLKIIGFNQNLLFTGNVIVLFNVDDITYINIIHLIHLMYIVAAQRK